MLNHLFAAAAALFLIPAAFGQNVAGDWQGNLKAGTNLRLVFHITSVEGGSRLLGTMDSPDQGVSGLALTAVAQNGATLTVEFAPAGIKFTGKSNVEGTVIEGVFEQQGQSEPLVLTRWKPGETGKPKRPQEPVKPYPYRDEDVQYENKTAGIQLGATLTIPQGKGPFPAVLLLTGSGQQDRDEAILGHKPFLVLADYLTRKGIAVLRADDRGIGKSGGNFQMSTTADFAMDAEAGIAYLKTRPEVNTHKIGLIGHSEGGTMAPMVAARNGDVAFIVMMAGPGVPGDQILVAQVRAIAESSGLSKEAAEKSAADERDVLALVEQEKDEAALKAKLRATMAGAPEAQQDAQIRQITSPWFRYFLTYDPAAALRKVKCPVLALNGSKDVQVPAKQNLPAIRKALEEAGNTHVEIDELAGLNHLFQTADTGSPAEYQKIEETIAPVVLEKIASWVLKQ